MKILSSSLLLICFSLLFIQCNKKQSSTNQIPKLPSTPYDYSYTVPPEIFGIDNTPKDNILTNDGATLGRVLFYDKKLSINNNTACGSCHLQENAFADKSGLSLGFEGNATSRNSSTIVNVVNQTTYFWDSRTTGLETMVLQPIRHQVEMGMEKPEILPKKLALTTYYPDLFTKAFGTPDITPERIAKAMSQFLRAMTSYDSKADQTHLISNGFGGGWGQTTDPRVTPEEKRGAQIFVNSGCLNCHAGDNLRGWNDEGEANIGLDLHYADAGIGAIETGKEGIFKIPSLRNVGKTAPYMHDGRFATLKEVINHYNNNVQPHTNLSPMLKNNTWGGSDDSPRKLNLTDKDVDDLVAFLETLTDNHIITSEKFSDPFAK